jgi:23S rRNA pseudouridine1911/1915/1917 synthase
MGSKVYLSDGRGTQPVPPVPPAEGAWIPIPLPVGDAMEGYRVDRFICARIPRLSRTRVQAFIAKGQLFGPEGRIDRPATRVHAGEVMTLWRPAPVEPDVVMDYGVVHRDDDLLVLDKPSGLPVHPSARYHLHTLTALMRERLGDTHGWQMAHRLDRETSGVIAFGRRGGSASALKRAFAQRLVRKEYLALVHGHVEAPGEIDVPIGPAVGSLVRVKMGPRPLDDGGLTAFTSYVPLARGTFDGQPITLLHLRPRTGRQHQIRVHLAAIGHGVLGDKLYGVDEQLFIDIVEGGRPMAELEVELGMTRHALHAARLTLPHPRTGQDESFVAPWPPELARILAAPEILPTACEAR